MFGIPSFAEESTQDKDSQAESPLTVDGDGVLTAGKGGGADTRFGTAGDTHTIMDAYSGYRFLHIDDFGGRAAEYDYLHSGPTFGGMINRLSDDLKFGLDGNYLNENDYYGDLLMDYRGEYRFHLRTESLFHNLDNEQLFKPNDFTFFFTPYHANDQDPGGNYGVKVEQDQASFHYKLHDYPLHINFGYWRLLRDGISQMRFADTMFEYNGTNVINSQARRINQETHEGNVGIDAHLGFVDLVYNFQIREFTDNIATPVYDYGVRSPFDPANPLLPGGNQQHNENPDSRYLAHTVKLHTSLDGGIVGAASYTFGKRENLSDLSDIQGANQGHDILQNVAGDFVYIPCKEITLALKFRRQEVDRDNPATLYSLVDSSTINVRPSLDTQRDTITASVSVRATDTISFKGEYKGDFLHRDNISFWNQPLAQVSQNLPENSSVHKGTVTVLSRPLKGLSLKAQYNYSVTDNPSYGNSFGEKHEGNLFASYNSPNRWGATANYRIARENNDQMSASTFATTATLPTTPPGSITFAQISNGIDRNMAIDNATVSAWFTPVDRLTLSASYGFLRAKTDQVVLFGDLALPAAGFPVAIANTNYTTQAQIYSLTGVFHYNKKLDLSLALQQIYSFSDISPESGDFENNGNTANIGQISNTKTVESSISFRAEYHFTKNFSSILDYTYRDYDEKIQRLFNGTVQSVSAYVSAKW